MTLMAWEDPSILRSHWRHWRSRHLEAWAKQRNFASCAIELLLVMIVVSCADIWIVYRRRLPSGILWIVAGCGRVMPTRRFSKLGPDRTLPIYMVDTLSDAMDDRVVAAVTTTQPEPDQLETLLKLLLSGPVVPSPPPEPVPSVLEQLLQSLLTEVHALRRHRRDILTLSPCYGICFPELRPWQHGHSRVP